MLGEGLARHAVDLFSYQLMPSHWRRYRNESSLRRPARDSLRRADLDRSDDKAPAADLEPTTSWSSASAFFRYGSRPYTKQWVLTPWNSSGYVDTSDGGEEDLDDGATTSDNVTASGSASQTSVETQTTTSTINWNYTDGGGTTSYVQAAATCSGSTEVDQSYNLGGDNAGDDGEGDDGQNDGPTKISISKSTQEANDKVTYWATSSATPDYSTSLVFSGTLNTGTSLSYTTQGVYTPTAGVEPSGSLTESESDYSLGSENISSTEVYAHGDGGSFTQVSVSASDNTNHAFSAHDAVNSEDHAGHSHETTNENVSVSSSATYGPDSQIQQSITSFTLSPIATSDGDWSGGGGVINTVRDSTGVILTSTVPQYGQGSPPTIVTITSSPQQTPTAIPAGSPPLAAVNAAHQAVFAQNWGDVFEEQWIANPPPKPNFSYSTASNQTSVTDAFFAGLGTGAKAVVNGTFKAIVSSATVGFVEGDNLLEVTKADMERGYGTAEAFANAGASVFVGVATGGAACALSKGGNIAKVASAGIRAYETASDAADTARAAIDIYENGPSLANVVQLGGQALASIPAIKGGCFFPGTPVATELGHKRIEIVLPGDRVWACDLTTSKWELRSVVETYVTEYVGETIRVMVAGEWIESTRHHPFWVAEGKNLADRPTPEHVAAAMAEGGTLPGRWVDAGDLELGDLVLFKDGRRAPIEAIEVHLVAVQVYNFQVEGLHNYAVGLDSVLAHNNCAANNSGGANAAQGAQNLNNGWGNLGSHGPVTPDVALRSAEKWLGAGYKEIAPGVYRSADGLRQFRMTASDLIPTHGNIGPHVHFEVPNPAGGPPLENLHIPVTP